MFPFGLGETGEVCGIIFGKIVGSGRGVAWIAHLNGVQEVAGSNPAAPILIPSLM